MKVPSAIVLTVTLVRAIAIREPVSTPNRVPLRSVIPVLRPRAPQLRREAGLAGNGLGRPAVRPVADGALPPAREEVEPPLRIAERRTQLPWRDRVQRPEERFGIVERRVHRDRLAVGA